MEESFDPLKEFVIESNIFNKTVGENVGDIQTAEKSSPEQDLETSEITTESSSLSASQNNEKGPESSNPSGSSVKLKDPPDLDEILSMDESLILPTSENVGILNNACQQVLKEMEYQLLELLKQNRKEQEKVLEFLNSNGKTSNSESSKLFNLKCIGIPYFKDFDGFFPPDNKDVLQKMKSQNLLPVDFIGASPSWSSLDSKNLIKAVNRTIKSLDLSDPVNYDSIDWMKISATDMEGKYSAVECKSKWMLHLKPEINKTRWGQKEIKSLVLLAKKFDFQDWDEIAIELGTNRSGLQCCVQYQSHRGRNGGKWTKEEDETLQELIRKYKIRDYIPWPKVSWHFEERSLRQCKERYDYHLCNIKKGNFSVKEDFVLVYLASKLKNFGEVAKYLPGRVSTQVRARYEYLVNISMPDFTKEEDELLTNLMCQYPRKWGKISEFFTNRSKLQCRRRWAVLQKQIELKKELSSDSELEESTLSVKTNTKTKTCENIDTDTLSKNLNKFSRIKPEEPTLKGRYYSVNYAKLLDYHKNCHKFLFGPRIAFPTDSEESEKICEKMKVIMTNLSVNFTLSLRTYNINSLWGNCEFQSDDLFLLERIKRTTLEPEDEEPRLKLSDKILPPNYINLVGLRTLTLSWSKIGNLCSFYEPQKENERNESIDPEKRLLFSDAKKLFKMRMKALFVFPLLMSLISQENMEVQPVCKPKVRKGFKRISKLKRKQHAKYMRQIYELKKKLNKKFSVSQNSDLVKNETGAQDETPFSVQEQVATEVLSEETNESAEKSNTNVSRKRKMEVKESTDSNNVEEPKKKGRTKD